MARYRLLSENRVVAETLALGLLAVVAAGMRFVALFGKECQQNGRLRCK